MKIFKRIFIGIGIILLLLIATAIIIPVFFKDKIMAVVKTQLNQQLNATTDFKDVDISLIRSFPRLSVSIEGLSIVGKDSFKGDTLIAAKSIDIALDLMKAINGSYDILNIGLVAPRIHAIVHDDGKANWDITKPAPPAAAGTAPSKPFAMKLRKYSIEQAFIEYNDQQGKMHVIIENLNHKGSGDFTSDAFTLSTKTTADAITFMMGNVPYLYKVKTAIDLDLGIDNKANKYSFNTEKIQLNGLHLATKGSVQMPDTTNMIIDVQFNTPSNDFKDILSLVPGIYQANFKDIKTSGKLTLSGSVKGKYNKTQIPSYHVNLGIQDGSFQYPDLPEKVSNIQIKLAVDNPDGITDHTIVNLEKCHIDLGAQPFDFRMLLKTPVTDQWIDASAKGRIDLAQMQKFTKLEAGTKLTGVITADVSVKGSMAAAQKKQFDKIDAAGTVGISNLAYSSKDYPDGVDIYSLLLTFNPKNVTVSNLKGQYMKTIFSGDGGVDNLLGYYLHNESLSGKFNFVADKVDVNKFMGTTTTPTTTATPAKPATEPFLVPSNLGVELHLKVGSVKYDNILLTNVQGGLVLRNQTMTLQNISGNGLDGALKINGGYSTKNDKKNPDINFEYGVQGVDVQKTFTTFNTIQKLMPFAKYASGKVTSNLTMTGKLGPDMSPVMNTLSGKGDLLLLSGVLSNFPVTDQLAEKLHLSQFKTITLKDSKLFFTFENGRLIIQPYKTNIAGIEAEIGGSNGFDQTIKYAVNLVVPTAMMGSAGTSMVNNLIGQAASKGVTVKVADKVNLAVNITGTTTSPKIETNLKNLVGDAVKDLKEEIKKEVQHKVDSVKTVVKTVVKDTVKAIKEQAKETAKEEIKKQILGTPSGDKKPDPVKDAGDKAKGALKGLFGGKK
ncbi:MAG: AsmA family protein [Flavipsychrobacter sp.]|nr:AsmA family protein [Flavipsychrobacter sp.]